MARRLPLLLPLLLVGGLGACGPVYRAGAAPAAPSAEQAPQQGQRCVGVWALVDNANNLFNVRLRSDGRATSTAGSAGTPLAGSGALQAGELSEQGRWRTSFVAREQGPLVVSHWQPGVDRAAPSTAVREGRRLD